MVKIFLNLFGSNGVMAFLPMKKFYFVSRVLPSVFGFVVIACAQQPPTAIEKGGKATEVAAKAEVDLEKKATGWVTALALNDVVKEGRVKAVILAHLRAVHEWHNEHPYTAVPAGNNSVTGKPLTNLDRQMIADGALSKTVHEGLMSGLRENLTDEQVETVLDQYTVHKVAFTLAGYHAIVPDLTKEEETTILGFLKQAREEAVDYKNMNQISAVFEIYKTKSEQYLNANGRDWKALYRAFTAAVKAKKAASGK